MTTETVEQNGATAAAEATLRVNSTAINVGEYRLSNGIVLEFRHVPTNAIRQAMQAVERPLVPVFHNEQKDRDEENPADPSYLLAIAEYSEAVAYAGQAIAFMLGIRVIDVPEGMYGPEDSEWVERLEAVGLTADVSNEPHRLYSWLTLYAIESEDDSYVCTRLALQKIGLTEDEMSAAIDSFRGRAERIANPVFAAATDPTDGGELLPDAPGDGAGD